MIDFFIEIFSFCIGLFIYHVIAVKPKIKSLTDENERLKRKLKKYE